MDADYPRSLLKDVPRAADLDEMEHRVKRMLRERDELMERLAALNGRG